MFNFRLVPIDRITYDDVRNTFNWYIKQIFTALLSGNHSQENSWTMVSSYFFKAISVMSSKYLYYILKIVHVMYVVRYYLLKIAYSYVLSPEESRICTIY